MEIDSFFFPNQKINMMTQKNAQLQERIILQHNYMSRCDTSFISQNFRNNLRVILL